MLGQNCDKNTNPPSVENKNIILPFSLFLLCAQSMEKLIVFADHKDFLFLITKRGRCPKMFNLYKYRILPFFKTTFLYKHMQLLHHVDWTWYMFIATYCAA